MRYQVIRANCQIKIGKKSYKSGETFDAEADKVKSLLKAKYIKEVKDGKANNK